MAWLLHDQDLTNHFYWGWSVRISDQWQWGTSILITPAFVLKKKFLVEKASKSSTICLHLHATNRLLTWWRTSTCDLMGKMSRTGFIAGSRSTLFSRGLHTWHLISFRFPVSVLISFVFQSNLNVLEQWPLSTLNGFSAIWFSRDFSRQCNQQGPLCV